MSPMRTMKTIMMSSLVVLLYCVSAAAQDGHTAPELESRFPWRAIGATAICFAGILLAGLKNSRRTQTKAG
jgi:hypothetical protein